MLNSFEMSIINNHEQNYGKFYLSIYSDIFTHSGRSLKLVSILLTDAVIPYFKN